MTLLAMFRLETRRLRVQPLAWVLLALSLAWLGWCFTRLLGEFLAGEIQRAAQPDGPGYVIADELRASATHGLLPGALRVEGLTPEDRAAYALFMEPSGLLGSRREERRLRLALERGGGRLHAYHDRGDFWLVEWRTDDGELHSSAIRKGDLTVIGAGICLSDRDRDFDLQSLVGVVRDRPDWMR